MSKRYLLIIGNQQIFTAIRRAFSIAIKNVLNSQQQAASISGKPKMGAAFLCVYLYPGNPQL
jgi:hypothetical protein